MINEFRFRLKTDSRFGVGLSKETGKIMKTKGLTKPIIIVDSGVVELKAVGEIIESIKGETELIKTYENKIAEPSYDYLDEVKKEFEGLKPDCVVGIGGGSTIDLAKGIATLMTNSGKGIEYRGFGLVKNPTLPIVAIPTTAGTGSEATFSAVFTEESEKKKLGINTEFNFPTLAILDPLLVMSCPKKVAVGSGMDAIVHTLESFVAKKATPTSRIFSKEAFHLLFNNLEKAVKNPKDEAVRLQKQMDLY